MSFRSYVIIPLVLLSAKLCGGTLNPFVDVLLNQLYILVIDPCIARGLTIVEILKSTSFHIMFEKGHAHIVSGHEYR
jgi:hypothetical protein